MSWSPRFPGHSGGAFPSAVRARSLISLVAHCCRNCFHHFVSLYPLSCPHLGAQTLFFVQGCVL